MESKRGRFADQQTEDTVSGGEWANPACKVFVDADRDEVAQRLVLAEDTQGAVAGMQQPAGGRDDPVQYGVQAQVFGDRHHRFQKSAHLFLGIQEFSGPGQKVPEQVFDPCPGDVEAISAHAIWNRAVHKLPFERYRPRGHVPVSWQVANPMPDYSRVGCSPRRV
ncbi:hypothetical protein GCM10027038_31320 [Arthrobacter bambusae]